MKMMEMVVMMIVMMMVSTPLSQCASFNHVAIESDDFRLVALPEAHCLLQMSLL